MEQLLQQTENADFLSIINSTYLKILKEILEKLKLDKSKLTLSNAKEKKTNDKMESVLSLKASLEAETNSMREEIDQLKNDLIKLFESNIEMDKEVNNLISQFDEIEDENSRLGLNYSS